MERRAMTYETAHRRCNIAWGLTVLGWILNAAAPNLIALAGWGVAAIAWGVAWYAVEQV